MKRYLILIALLILIFNVGCTFAADADAVNVNESTDLLEMADESEFLEINADLDIAGDEENEIEVSSWEDIQYYSSLNDKNYVLKLKENTNYYPANVSSADSQIIFKNNVTIRGADGAYIGDSSPNPREIKYLAMRVPDDSGVGITLQGITFKWILSNYTSDGVFCVMGGNAYNYIEDCYFTDITTAMGHSSILQIKSGDAVVNNCTFINCTTDYGCLSVYNPIDDPTKLCTRARMSVSNSYFEGNYAKTEPGCINNCGILVVRNTTFTKNSAFWWAGAIHTHGGANTTLYDSNFTDNVAGWNGGALYTYSYLQIYRCIFDGNNCTTDFGAGAIGAYNYLHNPYVHIEDSIFVHNTNNCWGPDGLSDGVGRGGAVSIYAGGLEVKNTTFIENSAAVGSAIYASGSTDVTLTGNKFINHTRAGDVLVIRISTDAKHEIKDNEYYNNSFEYKKLRLLADEKIGDVITVHIDEELKNPNYFESDILDTTEYDVYVDGVYNKTIVGRTFTLTLKNGETCHIYVVPSISNSATNEILVGVPKEYIYVSQKYGNDENSGLNRTSPVATIAKAVELAKTKGNIVVMDGTFRENNLSIDYNLSIVGENNVKFTGVVPLAVQTIFTVTGADFSLTNITFEDVVFNASNQNKDKKIIKHSGGYLTIDSCAFNRNSVLVNSGFKLIESSNVEVFNTVFTNHNIHAILIMSDHFSVDNCSFINNKASHSSYYSLIATSSSKSGIKGMVSNSIFKNNQVKNGCILFDAADKPLTVSDTVFEANKVGSTSDHASAIKISNTPTVNIEGCIFADNVNVGQRSAVIYCDNRLASIYVSNSIVLNNSFENNNGYVFSASTSDNLKSYKNLNGNWWGNTADNFTSAPKVYESVCSNWLVLNITSDVSDLAFNQSTSVRFDLFSAADRFGNITSYDAGRVPQFVLKISPGNGTSNLNNVSVINGMATCEYTLQSFVGGFLTASYNCIESTVRFNWSLIDPEVTIDVDDVTYGSDVEINVDISHDIDESKLIITVNETVYSLENITKLSNLNAGEYLINLTYLGDSKYKSYNLKKSFKVNKYLPQMSIDVNDSYFCDENITITVSINSAVSGNITVNVGNITETKNIDNGIVKINLSGLKMNNYTVTAVFEGNDNYFKATAYSSFSVFKYNSTIAISYGDVELGRDVILTFDVIPDATGSITVDINGNEENVSISGGAAAYTIHNIPRGIYKIKATYNGDDKYLPSTNATEFSVARLEPDLDVVVEDTDYGKNVTFEITMNDDATGEITVFVDGINKTVGLTNGKAIVNVSGLSAGNKIANISYLGDNTYVPADKSASFNISKVMPEINIKTSDIKEGQTANIQITLIQGTTGKVNLEYAGKSESPSIPRSGLITRNVEDLACGNYTVSLNYAGDSNYLPTSISKTFKVSSWNVPQWPNEGYDVQNTQNSPYSSDSNGNVLWISEINGTINSNMAIDSEGNVYITTEKGIYSINACGVLNWKFNSEDVNGSFSGISIYRDTVISPKSGDKIYFINQTTGEKYNNNIFQGSSIFAPVVDENANIYVTSEYQFSTSTYNLVVIPYKLWQTSSAPTLISIGSNIPLSSPVLINRNTAAIACENAILVIDLTTKSVTNSIPVVTSSDLLAGPGNILYAISGDSVVAITPDGSHSKTKISGSPGSHLSVGANGEIYAINKNGQLYDYSTGEEIFIYDFGESISSRLLASNDGLLYVGSEKGVFYSIDNEGNLLWKVNLNQSIKNIPIMDRNGTIYVNSGNRIIALGNAPLKDSNLSVNIEDIDYGEILNISIETDKDATGLVTVNIKNVYSNESVIINGNASFILSDLNAGNYTAEISYTGDYKFESKTVKENFEVKKLTPHVEIAAENIEVFQNLTVSINMTDNINDTVTVSINGNSKDVKLENGRGDAVFSDLGAGCYVVCADYLGDGNFNPVSVSGNVTVSRVDTQIVISAGDVCFGDDLVVNVSLDSRACGNVTVSVGDLSESVELVKGSACAVFSNFTSLGKVIYVVYNGDGNFNPSSADENISAYKINTSIVIFADDIDYGSLLEVKINLSNNITTNITVSLNNISQTVNVNNGFAVIIFDNLTAGESSIEARYGGDEKYNPSNDIKKISVNKVKPSIAVDVKNITVGEDEIIMVYLPNDACGNLTVNVDNKSYPLNFENGFANLTVSNLTPGQYHACIVFKDDANYLDSNESGIFVVTKRSADFNASCKDIVYGENASIIISQLPKDATGNVTVTINEITCSNEIEDGQSMINISDLSGGKYSAYVEYSGDVNYLPSNKTVEFKVDKSSPDMKIECIVTDGGSLKINIKLPQDATGDVLINLNGTSFNPNITDGSVELEIRNLPGGKYNLTAVYSGDGNYDTFKVFDSFNISKKGIGTIIEVESSFTRAATDFASGERGGIFYALLKDEYGNLLVNKTVQIAINGPIYNVTTDSQGRAGLTVNLAKANTYTYALFFKGDETYKASHLASSKLVVFKKSTSISAVSKTFKASAKSKTISVTLKTSKNPFDGKTYLKNGKIITLKLNGKTYSGKTNDKGIVNFNIKLTKKGSYSAKINFAGDNTYSSCSKSVKIIIG